MRGAFAAGERPALLLFLFFLVTAQAHAADALLDQLWPAQSPAGISDLGRGIAVVFSPDLSINSPQFGQVTSMASVPRQMQFGLRLRF